MRASSGECGNAFAPGLNQCVKAMIFGAGGKDAGLESRFGWVAEEGKLRGPKGWGHDSGHIRKDLRGVQQQWRGDGALADGDNRV